MTEATREFRARWCNECVRNSTMIPCKILNADARPAEWVEIDGEGVCTAFKARKGKRGPQKKPQSALIRDGRQRRLSLRQRKEKKCQAAAGNGRAD